MSRANAAESESLMAQFIEFTSIAVPVPAKRVRHFAARSIALESCEAGDTVQVRGQVVRLLEVPSEHGVVGGRVTYSARAWLVGAARETVVVERAGERCKLLTRGGV